ncbi:MAG: NAD(P)-dependent oxidoreductase [Planctomycetota bacterium]|jgi:D-3-phosphoglycerate dehydrogenase
MAAEKRIILVTEPLSERAMEYLRSHGEVREATVDTVGEQIAQADGLVVRTYTVVDKQLLARAKRLKVVGRAGVALDNIDVAACRRRGIEVVHTPEANTLAVVDYTVRMIIELNRRFWPMTSHMTDDEFRAAREQTFGRFLAELTLGIVGCGRIGSRVGRAAVGLGMKVLYNDILDIKVDYPAEAVDKPTLYARSDVVTLHVPLTELTRRMINRDTLSQFKPGAQLINSARGRCVDYTALAEALKSGRISAAAIDCHDPEPPPPDYPLWGLENVILTPHIAARVPAAMERMCDVAYDIVAVLDGRTPRFPAPAEQP